LISTLLLLTGLLAFSLLSQLSQEQPVQDNSAEADTLAFTARTLLKPQISVPVRALRTFAAANMTAATELRPVTKVVPGTKTMDGAGVPITRTIGTSALRNLDPYLMLDELKGPASSAMAGFPDHPHRGFETCTIMIEGVMEHKDSVGNHGIIESGGVQWMTAGRGIIHSEFPKVTTGRLWGFQLWINLPKKDKMVKPRYQDYQAKDIPVVEDNGVRVRVMAGEYKGSKGPIAMRNPGLLMDVTVSKGATFTTEIPKGWSAFAYVSEGSGKLSGTKGSEKQAIVFGDGDHVVITGESDTDLRLFLVAGQPINEPVVQYGPFVMNTHDEIEQAFRDYQSGRLQNADDNVWAE
jgi:redox-sensitive bicupin YhaK (pirin superfamily)